MTRTKYQTVLVILAGGYITSSSFIQTIVHCAVLYSQYSYITQGIVPENISRLLYKNHTSLPEEPVSCRIEAYGSKDHVPVSRQPNYGKIKLEDSPPRHVTCFRQFRAIMFDVWEEIPVNAVQ